ncbi:hypothetical protein ACFP1I_09315 [Dyadobacter subterraneus]|uniref:DUF5666 domain-containing protein n=1 Tax=Dyadobacter subterraneus TaxID=2773304 RepID=A0ABR9WC10_9BACT|nr:hypothetical protein [Dyadobacter subterraneus]MBE9462699.1 hypothetical protein [Dyadobacter subterraneus]
MKKLALAALFISVVTGSTNHVFAQIAGPLAGAMIAGPGVNGPGPRPPFGPGAPGEQGLRAVTTVQGKVVKLWGNDDFVFDGFYLLSGTDSLLVKFPAHMGSQVSGLTKPGSQVSVSGVLEMPPFGSKELRMVNLNAGGKTLTDTPPTMLPTPAQEIVVSGNGKVTSLQTDREGRVNGLFVDNKTVLRFPPHIAAQIGNSVAKGTAISYSGSQKSKEDGEITLQDYKVIRCNTITVNGQQYLVR